MVAGHGILMKVKKSGEQREQRAWEHVVQLSARATHNSVMFLRWERHGYLLQPENTSANMSADHSALLPSPRSSLSCSPHLFC